MNIRKIVNKCKSRELYIIMVIVFTSFGSFALGRLSIVMENRPAVVVNRPLLDKAPASSVLSEADGKKEDVGEAGGLLVASKTGSKYHFPWCVGAKNISESNKTWFNSYEEARKAGYLPAGNCKGLR